MVPLELLEQSPISLRMRNRNFKQNKILKTVISQTYATARPSLCLYTWWRIQYVKHLLGIAHASSLLIKHSTYLCKKYPSNCAPKFLHSSIMTWYTKTSFNETGNLEMVTYQLKMTYSAVLLTQSCSCRLVIYWEWLARVASSFFSLSVDIWILLCHFFSIFGLWMSMYFSFVLFHSPPPLSVPP